MSKAVGEDKSSVGENVNALYFLESSKATMPRDQNTYYSKSLQQSA